MPAFSLAERDPGDFPAYFFRPSTLPTESSWSEAPEKEVVGTVRYETSAPYSALDLEQEEGSINNHIIFRPAKWQKCSSVPMRNHRSSKIKLFFLTFYSTKPLHL